MFTMVRGGFQGKNANLGIRFRLCQNFPTTLNLTLQIPMQQLLRFRRRVLGDGPCLQVLLNRCRPNSSISLARASLRRRRPMATVGPRSWVLLLTFIGFNLSLARPHPCPLPLERGNQRQSFGDRTMIRPGQRLVIVAQSCGELKLWAIVGHP